MAVDKNKQCLWVAPNGVHCRLHLGHDGYHIPYEYKPRTTTRTQVEALMSDHSRPPYPLWSCVNCGKRHRSEDLGQKVRSPCCNVRLVRYILFQEKTP